MPCGIMAAVLALMTQIVASAAMGCCGWCFGRCPTPKSKGKRVLAVILFILLWYVPYYQEIKYANFNASILNLLPPFHKSKMFLYYGTEKVPQCKLRRENCL